MNLGLLASAAAASLLAAGVAHAQPGSSASPNTGVAPNQATPVPPQPGTTGLPAPDSASTTTTTTTTTTTGTDVTASTTTAPSAAAAGSNASFTTKVLTNGPVPDTAENRQKYGGPMSRAGKHTAPRGN